MAVTEVAFLPLQEGKTLDDPTSAASQIHSDCLNIVLSQPGCQGVYWGLQVENSLLLLWFVEWDNIEDHITFTKADDFKSLIGLFAHILGGAPSAYHVQFIPCPTTTSLNAKTAPIIEIVTMWVPTSYSQGYMDKVTASTGAFLSILEKEAKNYRGSATGWVYEDIAVSGTEEKEKAFVMLIGWTSVGAHEEFTNAQAFKENIHLVMGAKDMRKIEAVHTSLTKATRVNKQAVVV